VRVTVYQVLHDDEGELYGDEGELPGDEYVLPGDEGVEKAECQLGSLKRLWLQSLGSPLHEVLLYITAATEQF
jgi:hypothetical protein